MKSISVSISIVLLAIFIPGSLFSQWIQTNGPYRSPVEITGIVAGGSHVIVSADQGILYSSTDHGNTWGIMQNNLVPIALDGANCWANRLGVSGPNVFLSPDFGAHWIAADTGLDNNIIVTILFHDGRVFAGTNTGVYQSANNGTSWINKTTLGTGAYSLAARGSLMFAATLLGVIRSTDYGETWTVTPFREPNYPASLSQLAMSGDTLLAAPLGSGLWRSTDDGNTWTASDFNFGSSISRFIARGDSSILALTYTSGVYISTDNGTTWSSAYTTITGARSVGMVFDSLWTYSYNTGEGIWISSDNGEHWVPSNIGKLDARISSLAVIDSTVVAGTTNGVFSTSDNGAWWTSDTTGIQKRMILTVAADYVHLFAGTYNGIYISTDHVSIWSWCGDSTMNQKSVNAVAVMDTFLVAGTDIGVFIAPARSLEWTLSSFVYSTLCLAVSNGVLYAGTGHGVYRSTDSGTTWNISNPALQGKHIFSFAGKDSILFAATDSGVYRSTDGGNGWRSPTNALARQKFYSLAYNNHALFAGGDGLVYVTTDDGERWTFAGEGLDEERVSALALCGNYIYAGTDGESVWRRSISEMITAVEEHTAQVGEYFWLRQNYPNPFNPTTRITYTLPVHSQVHFAVYNILGQIVANLVEGVQVAGSNSVEWNAAGMPSGVYFYRLDATNVSDPSMRFSQTRKMVLIK